MAASSCWRETNSEPSAPHTPEEVTPMYASLRPADRRCAGGQPAALRPSGQVEAAWRVVDPVLDDAVPVHRYPRGTWGPEEADALLPSGGTWHDPVT